MSVFEYKVVPAPTRGEKARGLRTPEDRFANALERSMNELAAKGWQYLRADTLPCEERTGILSGRTVTVYRSVLVFRRALPVAAGHAEIQSAEPEALTPEPATAAPATGPAPLQAPARGPGALQAIPGTAAAWPTATPGRQPGPPPSPMLSRAIGPGPTMTHAPDPSGDPPTAPGLRAPGPDTPRPPRPVRRDG